MSAEPPAQISWSCSEVTTVGSCNHLFRRKAFLPVEPQSGLSFLFLLGRTQVRLRPLLYQVSGHRQIYFRPAEASPAQEYRLRLKQPAPTLSPSLGGPLYLNPQPVSFLPALALPGLLPRRSASASLSARKICPAYFSTETERRKTPAAPKASPLCCGSQNQLTNRLT